MNHPEHKQIMDKLEQITSLIQELKRELDEVRTTVYHIKNLHG